jgi:hypothetical protein
MSATAGVDPGGAVAYSRGNRRAEGKLPQPPADQPAAVAAVDGVEKPRKRLLRPSSARSFVVELGAVAGAIVSIVAVVKLVLPHHHVSPKTHVVRHVRLSLAGEHIHVTTLRDYLLSIGANPPKRSPGLDVRGFTAPYTLNVSGFKRGSIVHVRFEVWRDAAGIERIAVPPSWDHVQVARDPDKCTCASTFIELPRGAARYRLVIGVFPPGTQETNPGSPLKTVETEFRNSA